jgi:hypothetical protein
MGNPKVTGTNDFITMDMVEESEIVKSGDWLLKWNPRGHDEHHSGYELFTPPEFDHTTGNGPLGGLLLAAFFYLIENEDEALHKSIIKRANDLADKLGEIPIKKQLNS